MLSKDDYTEIRKILKEEIGILKEEIRNETKKIVHNEIAIQLKPIKKDISQIRKDQKIIINFFDHEYLELRKRVERIEEHLGI